MKTRVFVAMSGGVDSSVAAALLKKRGFSVVGIHMKCWSQGSADTIGKGVACSAEEDAESARRAAETLKIPFYVFDFEKEYTDKVVQYMIDGYRRGITPNPDVMCNKEIKFGLFLKKALEMGADYVATGHYVKIRPTYLPTDTGVVSFQQRNASTPRSDFSDLRQRPSKSELRSCRTANRQNSYSLFISKDKNKDQSYFLWTLTQEQLQHCIFPIGDYLKLEVRAMARKLGLPNADKKDSQGVSFIGKVALEDFIGHYLPSKKGMVLNTAGAVIGEHNGAHFYTIGQRQGLKIGGFRKPLYVAEKDIRSNTILVAEGDDNPALYQKDVTLKSMNFINPKLSSLIRANGRMVVFARVRYRQPVFPATINQGKNRRYEVFFKTPQKFVAVGQSAVLYDKSGQLLGGGTIV